MSRAPFRHLFMRHGVWAEARVAPPQNEFGPGALLGLLRFFSWGGDANEVKAAIRNLTKNELRIFVAFAYEWGRTVTGQREVLRWARGQSRETEPNQPTTGATGSDNG